MVELNDFTINFEVRPTDPKVLLDSGPPRALYKVNPRLILGQEWWDKMRRKAYSDFLNMCAACGAQYVRLEAHELYTVDKRMGKVYLKDVVPLCSDCHSFIHRDIHRALIKKGALKYSDVERIIAHGKAVLRKAGLSLSKCKRPNDCAIPHDKWRLVLNGIEYAPVFQE